MHAKLNFSTTNWAESIQLPTEMVHNQSLEYYHFSPYSKLTQNSEQCMIITVKRAKQYPLFIHSN